MKRAVVAFLCGFAAVTLARAQAPAPAPADVPAAQAPAPAPAAPPAASAVGAKVWIGHEARSRSS